MTSLLSSAGGIISLLDEKQEEIKVYALTRLNEEGIIRLFWAEIADALEQIEILHEDKSFKARHLAALVASKVYFNLGAFGDSLNFALEAGDMFDVNERSEFVQMIINHCIDEYSQKMKAKQTPDVRLENLVNRMFDKSLQSKNLKQVIGIAIECNRFDVMEKAISSSLSICDTLNYCLHIAKNLIQSREQKQQILRLLIAQYLKLQVPDYLSVCQCLVFLDDAEQVSSIMKKLLDEDCLMAYQIGFELYENAPQGFLNNVAQSLRGVSPSPLPADMSSTPVSEESAEQAQSPPVTTQKTEKDNSPAGKLYQILSGDKTTELYLQFLIRNNKTDLLILKHCKESVRNSICHTGTVISNSFMHSGTTTDTFLRDNLDWLGRATNWAKFTATASLGVIHKGHEENALERMATYLPADVGNTSPYQDGGGLYALGLIHANHGSEKMITYLKDQLKSATNEVIVHGGCLGLGLAAMGTERLDVYELLKNNLQDRDDAIIGEAAGLAMGLVMMGSNRANIIEEMCRYAADTQHEKIIRGLSTGVAMIAYNRLEEADDLVDNLLKEKDAVMRRCAMYCIGMAYAGSSKNSALKKLLHIAVSDVSDDVRRAAVEAIGFVMFRNPDQMPAVVSLLSESYNPSVRYGSAMALGIGCAGTGSKEALAQLEPLCDDSIAFVRQGAYIASAMVLIQQTEELQPKVKTFREKMKKTIEDKHEDSITKFGAILATGIIDAGGRNVMLGFSTRSGHLHGPSVVGMLVFLQFWFWFPLSHFLSLAFRPSAVICLNANLDLPKIEIKSDAKPAKFAYPPMTEEKKGKEKEKVETAVLSITAKAKARQRAKKIKAEGTEMETDDAVKTPVATTDIPVKEEPMETEEKPIPSQPEVENKFEIINNPCRALNQQLKVLSFSNDQTRYNPLKPLTSGGIILLRDGRPDEVEELLEAVAAGGPKAQEEEAEPEQPKPFEFTE